MINLSADVVVVAAGLSGLAAAVAAAEEGKSVIAVEKLDYPNFSEGSCIVIKWDSYEDTDVYEIIMLDQELQKRQALFSLT